ncbi:hypothetical protein BGZ65_012206, partial [Modicella reniformis]
MNSQDALFDDINRDLLGCNTPLDKDVVFAKRILLTGGAGFIGSVLAKKLVLNYPEYFILVIDKLDYCSSLNNLRPLLPLDEWPVPISVTTATTTTTTTISTTITAATAATTTTTTATTTVADQSSTGSCSSPKSYPNFKFILGDITDLDTIQTVMIDYKIDTVIHLASQTHVDKSFGESIDFTRNNVLGAHVMLEAARKVFCSPTDTHTVSEPRNGQTECAAEEEEGKEKGKEHVKRFLYISTDEVYGEVMLDQPDRKEDAPLAPSNPYSATKAAAESMVQAYHKSFHLPIIITRSNNVYGPFQYPEKIFPKFIMSLLNNKNPSDSNNNNNDDNYLGIENNMIFHRNVLKASNSRRGIRTGGHCYIHGSGQHSRTYLYVTDVADALDVILHRGEVGQVYNIGGGYEMSNLELAQDLIHRMILEPSTDSPGDMELLVKPIPARWDNG